MIIQITKYEQLTQAFAEGLVNLYQDIFSEAPYYEFFSDEEVKILFNSYFKDGILFLKYVNREVIGFSATLPFIKSSIFQARINDADGKSTVLNIDFLEKQLGFISDQTWCLEDVGIKQSYQGKGFGTELNKAQFKLLQTYKTVILRTSQLENDSAQNFYRYKLGFQFLNITQDVEHRRQDGTVQTDRRVFMVKMI